MKDIVKHDAAQDGFDGFEDAVQNDSGEEQSRPPQLIQGDQLIFTGACTWMVKGNPDMPVHDLKLIAVDVIRVVQRWKEKRAIETRVLRLNELVPDVAKLNSTVPIEEWDIGPSGQKTGPYQFSYFVYLFDDLKVQKYTYISSTVGGGIAVRALVDAVKWFRKWRKGGVCPVIQLRKVWMNTRYQGRDRPHLEIVGWVKPDEDANALPSRDPPKLSGPAANDNPIPTANDNTIPDQRQAVGAEPFADRAFKAAPLQKVDPPSLKEETGDEIVF